MDKCQYCPNEAEYKCMVEDAENPAKHHTEDVCSECINRPDVKAGLIDSWTKAEWLAMD